MTRRRVNIYGGQDPRELPAYTMTEAARYLELAPATLRSWVAGRRYPKSGGKVAFFEPLIQRPDPSGTQLSFWNLVEAHVLRALRVKHSVSIKAVRVALDFAQDKYDINRLLLSPELRTEAGDLFLDKYGELINLSKSGQLAMKTLLEDYLERIDWGTKKLPIRLYPFSRGFPVPNEVSLNRAFRLVVIDPHVSFGRPVIERKGISTAIISDRIDAGESVQDLAEDYDLEPWEINGALIYEKAA